MMKTRRDLPFLPLALGTFLWATALLEAQEDTAPLNVGTGKQLFIDHKFIASKENITLAVNPPVKLPKAVIKSDKPWDAFRLIGFSVAEEEDGYKMWYQAFDNDQWGGGRSRMCYATSKDLLTWDKPNLRIIEYQGSKKNNIIIDDIINGSVFIDPHARPGQRYKLIYTDHRGWKDVYVVTSADGIHWQKPGEPDCGVVQCGSGLHFRRGNYLYQFYAGWPWTHRGFRRLSPAQRQDKAIAWGRQHVYLVRQRLDGFVSADAPYSGGWLVTPPILFEGNRLELNINVAAMGEARVEIQDALGKPIPGFRLGFGPHPR